jgi:hypothetical protein
MPSVWPYVLLINDTCNSYSLLVASRVVGDSEMFDDTITVVFSTQHSMQQSTDVAVVAAE